MRLTERTEGHSSFKLLLKSFLMEGTALETTKAVERGMAEPLLWRRWAKGGESAVRQIGS